MTIAQIENVSEPEPKRLDVVVQPSAVNRHQHEIRNRHRSAVVWLTGLPGAGKSTIARATERMLFSQGLHTVVLDGDNLRTGLCSDLDFTPSHRNENVRRVAETAKIFLNQGTIVIVALVSPFRQAREQIKQVIDAEDFLEIYCRCPPAVCQHRDPKGHYARARRGEINEFTGVSSTYEEPLKPALLLNTDSETVKESVRRLSALVFDHCGAVAPARQLAHQSVDRLHSLTKPLR